MKFLQRSYRLVAGLAIGAALGGAGMAYAAGGETTPVPAPSIAAATSGGILADIGSTLDRLVERNVITATQADAIQRQAGSGSIDPKVLTEQGVVTPAQMEAVAAAIGAVKSSFDPKAGG
ncbi:MAG TPA: hypothetical protein VGH14_18975 [Solirubrobacterales bacterium]|jgi:hypothetical protein